MDPFLLTLLLLFAVVLWFMSSRSRRQQREQSDFRANLEVGQEVMTGSGLFGVVVDVDGDVITLESAGSQSMWLRAAIAKLAEPPFAPVGDDEDDEDAADGDAADGDAAGAERKGPGAQNDDDLGLEVPDDLSGLEPRTERRDDDEPGGSTR